MKKDITIIGLGYIGLPTAIILALSNHDVKGYDANQTVVETLKSGQLHIVEENLLEEYKKVIDSKNLTIYDQIPTADIYIICVPTPFIEIENKKHADLTYVYDAIRNLAPMLKKDDLIILESTVPPCTTKTIEEKIMQYTGMKQDDFYVVHCPERVLPGNILYELRNNDRIIGSSNKEAALYASELYQTFMKEGKCYITDDITAEMCKLIENTYRDVNIALSNELSIICDKLKIDIFELISLANKHPRVNLLNPGVGVGGHCLAVDPWFIVEKFNKDANLIEKARTINEYKPLWISQKVEQLINYNKETNIGILGLSYKPNIDDLRESPSINLALSLKEKGYQVYGCEPNTKKTRVKNIEIKNINEIIRLCDFLVIAQDHKYFLKPEIKTAILKKPNYNCMGLK